ncbi:MAG: DUF4190 domain-containing protein [Planctomycetota bacterium]|jgi:hypothetical protein
MEEQTQAPAEPTQSQPLSPHRGTLILVFGILSIVCCLIFGIVAWVMANKDLSEMAAGRMDPSGEGMTKAGKICGIIGIALQIVGLVIQLIIMILGAGIAATA